MITNNIPKAFPKSLSFEFFKLFIVFQSDYKIEEALIDAGLSFELILFDQFVNSLFFKEEGLMVFVGHDLPQ